MKSTNLSNLSLSDIGWRPFFQQQINLEELDLLFPARVVEHHRSEFEVLAEQGPLTIQITPSMPAVAVGDWLLLTKDVQVSRVLERNASFSRKAAGSKIAQQTIAANVDTAFIVCSLNEDFNLNRIERFLSMVNESGAEPVIVLTKEDLCENPDHFRDEVQALDSFLSVVTVNGLQKESAEQLLPWCGKGRTVVLLGSSGAGKSTLVNTLLDEELQSTGGIREDDSKGRHTTTARSLLAMTTGALLLDTPGMRELQLAACEDGVSVTFRDIESLADQCRFSDCQHNKEPGCAVQQALENGDLDSRRFTNYLKLMREQALNSASLAERRASDKKLSRYYKSVMSESVKNKRGD